jgi:hypothetical protein
LPEAISSPQVSGDAGLDPTTTTVSGYAFYEPAGLAYAPTGELYVADSQRNAVMRVGLDMKGEIGPTSSIQRIVGDGAGRWVPDLGESFPGKQLPLNRNPSTEGVSTPPGLGWDASEQRIARCQSRRPSPRT